MKAIVTGSNGFIGSHIVEALLQENIETVCLFRKGGSTGKYLEGLPIKKHFIEYDKPETLVSCPAFDEADYVIHVAGVTKRVTKQQFIAGNVEPTQNLLETIRAKTLKLKRFVFISSQAAAGPAKTLDHPITENDKPRPLEIYGESKFIAEQIVQEYGETIPFTIIRPPAVYGPRDVDFFEMFQYVRKGINIYASNRDSYISIVHVDDLTRGILDAMKSPEAANKTYFLSNKKPIAWHEVKEVVERVVGRSAFDINIPKFVLKVAGKCGDLYSKMTGRFSLINSPKIELSLPKYWLCSAELAKRDFGFQPETKLEEGMKGTYEWYQQNGWLRGKK